MDAPSPRLAVQGATGDILIKSGRGQYKTDPGSTDIIQINPQGTDGYMYEWELSVDYIVNAEMVTKVSRIFRSYIRGSTDTNPITYDYDPELGKWVAVPAVAG